MINKKYQPFIQIMTSFCYGYDEETGGRNYRLYHQLRVAENAYRICKLQQIPGVDEKIAVIGGLFHDIGRIEILKKNKSKILRFNKKELDKQNGHEEVSKEVIRRLLKKYFLKEELDKICKAIEVPKNHSARTSENKVLYDADILDELGSLNIFRMFTYSGAVNRDLIDTINYWFYTDRRKKLDKIPTLFTKFAKKESKRRIKLQDKVMSELKNLDYIVKQDLTYRFCNSLKV